MEKLTEFRFEGGDHVNAWCPICKTWIDEVEMVLDCNPYNRDYAMCPDCHTGIARSE